MDRDLREQLQYYDSYSILVEETKQVDMGRLRHARDQYIERLNGIYRDGLQSSGVELVWGSGKFLSPTELGVWDNGSVSCTPSRLLRAPRLLVATGGHPSKLPIPGAELGITSDEFFELREVPKRTVIIGGGYIACELSGILQGLGSDVSVVVRKPAVLSGFDDDVRASVEEGMAHQGVTILHEQQVSEIQEQPDGLRSVHLESGGQVLKDVDCVIFATGRAPSTKSIGLDEIGVKMDKDGFLETDAFQATSQPSVFSVGDIASRKYQLTPVAIAAGRLLSDRLFGQRETAHKAVTGESGDQEELQQARLVYDDVPSVIFTHPPAATVGCTEAEANERYGADMVRVFRAKFVPLFYGLSPSKPKTLMKVVCALDKDDPRVGMERVVGIHIVGPSADEMIQGFALAVKLKARKRDLDSVVAIHPTSSEELVTMVPWRPHIPPPPPELE